METLTAQKDLVLQIYDASDSKQKQSLEIIFGIRHFKKDVISRIKTYIDACQDLGLDPDDQLPFINPMNDRQEAANAFTMLDIITESLLEGVKLDWTNENQQKWYPYFNNYKPGAGFRFVVAHCGWSNADTGGGARLCVDTQEKAQYLGTQFLDIWNKFLNPNK